MSISDRSVDDWSVDDWAAEEFEALARRLRERLHVLLDREEQLGFPLPVTDRAVQTVMEIERTVQRLRARRDEEWTEKAVHDRLCRMLLGDDYEREL